MKAFTTLSLIGAISALALSATAASAQPHDGWTPINQRQAQLEQRIDRGVRHGDLTRVEARQLRGEFRHIKRLEAQYRANGLSPRERADLDRRFDRLAAQIHTERHDRQHG
jgi:hypothetical protein